MRFITKLFTSLAFLAPVLAFAAAGDFTEVSNFIQSIIRFINGTLVPFVFAIAFLFFIWGIFTYFIRGSDDESKREEGRQYMMWGIIGFVIMVSVWGIVQVLSKGLGLDQETLYIMPNVETTNP